MIGELVDESHQWKLVDSSDSAYAERTEGEIRIPPTGVGGLFRSNLLVAAKWVDEAEIT
jgi:hypothetical protein